MSPADHADVGIRSGAGAADNVESGESAQYVLTYKVAIVGTATLSVTANGTEGESRSRRRRQRSLISGSRSGFGRVPAERCSDPERPRSSLGDTDKAEIPQDVVAAVTLTNVSNVAAGQHPLQRQPDGLVPYRVPGDAVVPVTVTSGPTGPAFGPVEPGAWPAGDRGLRPECDQQWRLRREQPGAICR